MDGVTRRARETALQIPYPSLRRPGRTEGRCGMGHRAKSLGACLARSLRDDGGGARHAGLRDRHRRRNGPGRARRGAVPVAVAQPPRSRPARTTRGGGGDAGGGPGGGRCRLAAVAHALGRRRGVRRRHVAVDLVAPLRPAGATRRVADRAAVRGDPGDALRAHPSCKPPADGPDAGDRGPARAAVGQRRPCAGASTRHAAPAARESAIDACVARARVHPASRCPHADGHPDGRGTRRVLRRGLRVLHASAGAGSC